MIKTSDFQFDKTRLPWTGLPPEYGICPGVNPQGIIHSLPLLNLNSTRQEYLDYFNNTWTLTEVLFSGLANEQAFFRRPYHQLRHPMIFYYVHPAVLYVNKLRVAGLLKDAVNPHFENLFEVGVDEMRWDDLHEGQDHVWPNLEAAVEYRKTVYMLVKNIILNHPDLGDSKKAISMQSPLWSLVMGFEHERIHLETSSVLIRELPLECVRRPVQWPGLPAAANKNVSIENKFISQSAGQVELGKPANWPSFGWDNEYGYEKRDCSEFAASEFLVSNAEFYEFVKDGGYSKQEYWSKDGWQWREFRNTQRPTFWIQNGPMGLHDYKLRTVFEVIDIPYDWPVCVNFHEAKAFCAWKTEKSKNQFQYRLLSEAEHKIIRTPDAEDRNQLGPQDDSVMSGRYHQEMKNLNLRFGSESPVTASKPNEKGFYDTGGNVWTWCEDTFHPLPGAKPHPYYIDFSTPCYDGRHQMILGGSFASTGDEASMWARFHFRPHFFQHAGLRMVRVPYSRSSLKTGNGFLNYESDEMIHKYLLMHWGSDQDIYSGVPRGDDLKSLAVHLPQKCTETIVRHSSQFDKVLDLGCAVGRASFELSKHFKHVDGIDYSFEFIKWAEKIRAEKQIQFLRKDTGRHTTEIKVVLENSINTDRIHFQQGDACYLPSSFANYDAVLLSNVLCRLPDPAACLRRMQGQHGLVKAGGILVMTTPLSWLEEYTPKEKWLEDLEDIQKVLSEFILVEQEEWPFVIREHSRKFEFIITRATVWKRKP